MASARGRSTLPRAAWMLAPVRRMALWLVKKGRRATPRQSGAQKRSGSNQAGGSKARSARTVPRSGSAQAARADSFRPRWTIGSLRDPMVPADMSVWSDKIAAIPPTALPEDQYTAEVSAWRQLGGDLLTEDGGDGVGFGGVGVAGIDGIHGTQGS